eukprot:m.285237 g.285237  ORF g.285237 m.285237 type:complete len:92 (-) comp19431_c0_seq4:44-319(-)
MLSASAGTAVICSLEPGFGSSVRVYNQPTGPDGKGLYYKGTIDALLKTVKAEGVFGLYKGVGALYLRIGPHTVLTFVFWEQLKRLVRLEQD